MQSSAFKSDFLYNKFLTHRDTVYKWSLNASHPGFWRPGLRKILVVQLSRASDLPKVLMPAGLTSQFPKRCTLGHMVTLYYSCCRPHLENWPIIFLELAQSRRYSNRKSSAIIHKITSWSRTKSQRCWFLPTNHPRISHVELTSYLFKLLSWQVH